MDLETWKHKCIYTSLTYGLNTLNVYPLVERNNIQQCYVIIWLWGFNSDETREIMSIPNVHNSQGHQGQIGQLKLKTKYILPNAKTRAKI